MFPPAPPNTSSKKKKNKAPLYYSPFAGLSSPYASNVYNPFDMVNATTPYEFTPNRNQPGFIEPIVINYGNGRYAPNPYYFGYEQGFGGGPAGNEQPGNQQPGDFVGYFPGLRDRNGNWIYGPNNPHDPLGGGWGNRNLVYGGPGGYQASWYGERALGLSDLNVNRETGELQGSLNRYGQPLGTEGPIIPSGGPGYNRSARTIAVNRMQRGGAYAWNAERGKIGPTIKRIQRHNRRAARNRAEEEGRQRGGGGPSDQQPIWYNDLINWQI